jgi:N-acetylmuramoyl-L-alanine amidase
MLRKSFYLPFSLVILLSLSILLPRDALASSLKDIPSKYSTEINYLVNKGMIAGYPGGYFKPDRPVTREEAATMIGRAIKLNGTQRETAFTDVSSSSYASGFIQSAYEKDIINGYGDDTYKPKREITRGEMAILISKAFNLTEMSNVFYNDVATSGTVYEAINQVSTAGIAAGYPGGSYKPNKSITRAEFALLVARSINPDFKVEEVQPKPIAEKYVNTYELNVRVGPGTNFDKVGLVREGTKVNVYKKIGNWFQISYGNINGYVHGAYLDDKISADRVIAIDPGHGGDDPGAIGNGLQEKEINLDVSLRVKNYLERAGIKVVMTRTDDTFVSLSGRVDYAVNKDADTFVSIHTNSFSSGSANGTETYYSSAALSDRAQASKQLATFIQKRLITAWQTSDRGVKDAGFRVIKYNPLPSALVELGFITNSSDAKKLASNQSRESAAKAISLGIQDYYEWKKK